jgi:hypothetical protein
VLKEERLKTQNVVRATLIQAVGGILLVLGAITAWRQLQISQRQLTETPTLTREHLAITSQGQLADRLARAIEHLGNSSTDVRIGAIYTLEMISENSSNERNAILELLTAYVRTCAPRQLALGADNKLFTEGL